MAEANDAKNLPHEFAVADATLSRILDDELTRIASIRSIPTRLRQFSRDVKPATERYVNELFRIEGGRNELKHRAMLLVSLTGDGTEFDQSWTRLRSHIIHWNEEVNGDDSEQTIERRGHVATALHHLSKWAMEAGRAQSLLRLEELVASLQVLLQSPRQHFDAELRQMEQAASDVWNEVERSETEGCAFLLASCCGPSADATDSDLRAFAEYCGYVIWEWQLGHGAPAIALEPMKAAVESLSAWVRSQVASRGMASLANTLPVPDDQALLSAQRLAHLSGTPSEALRKRLERFRKRNHEGWTEDTEGGKGGPRFVYQYGAVKHLLDGN